MSTMFATQQAYHKSPEELTLSSFAALLSAAQFNGLPQSQTKPQEQHMSLPKMLSLWPPGSTHCKFPSMSLKNSSSTNKEGMQLKNVASMNMAMPLTASPEDIHLVPSKLLYSLCDSFMSLVNSRLRSSACALLRKAQNMDEWKAKEMLMLTKMLLPSQGSGGQPAVISTAVTSFRSLPPTANQFDTNAAYNAAPRSPQEIILPLVFEAGIDLRLLDSLWTTVSVRAPGSLSGVFSPIMHSLLAEVEISLDTSALLDSLMNSARSVVKQIIAIAVGLVHNEMQLCRMAASQYEMSQQELDVRKGSCPSLANFKAEDEEDQESDYENRIALPRRMSELSEFQAEPTDMGGCNQSFLLDLNRVNDSTDENGLPNIRIGDLYNRLSEERNRVSIKEEKSNQRSPPMTSGLKRTSSLLRDRGSSEGLSRPAKKRVSFSMFPRFQY